ncbi:MAG: hypothetical protein COB02_02680 [Candidatus Cloacimonadota bacterium]|nr:MAG: hypothetical protein COB02_02680 [Candidatus Cloacimonadota bacterium]
MLSKNPCRSYGVNLNNSSYVDYENRWNNDLESQVQHPIIQHTKPYWKPHKEQLKTKLVNYKQNKIRPLRFIEPSVELQLFLADTSSWDQNFGSRKTNQGFDELLHFNTAGLSYDLSLRFKAINYNYQISYLSFHNEEKVDYANSALGYQISFGDVTSEVTGLAKTELDFLRFGNERILDRNKYSQFTLMTGLGFLKLDRFERMRGNDKNGLNSEVSSNPAAPIGDKIIIDLGEDKINRKGLGLYMGFRYQSVLTKGLSWSTQVNLHQMQVKQNQSYLLQKEARSSLFESVTTNFQSKRTETLLDYEIKFQKYLRDFYNLSLGFRWLQFTKGPSKSLSGLTRDKFLLKGLTASVQRFF